MSSDKVDDHMDGDPLETKKGHLAAPEHGRKLTKFKCQFVGTHASENEQELDAWRTVTSAHCCHCYWPLWCGVEVWKGSSLDSTAPLCESAGDTVALGGPSLVARSSASQGHLTVIELGCMPCSRVCEPMWKRGKGNRGRDVR